MADNRSSPERRAQQSAIMKKRWADPERGKKQRAAIASPASREKIGEAAKARWADPEMRAKMIATMRNTTKRVGQPPRAR